MGSEWSLLKDLVRIKGGKRLPKGSSLQVDTNDHPYIRVRDMGSRYIPREGLEYVPDDVFPKIKNYIVEENDVIISIVGSVGFVSVIDDFFHSASQTENCAKLSGLDKQDALYLYYCLISPQGQQEIATQTVGAVQRKLPLYGIENISIPWPEKFKRYQIVHILGSLDDKIELNRQMNATLESMAQALFKSWFVDFDPVIDNALAVGNPIPEPLQARAETRKALGDKRKPLPEAIQKQFPSRFVFSEEMGWLPEGWSLMSFDELGKVSTGKTPPKKIEDAFSTLGVPFITPTDVDDSIYVISPDRYLTESGIASIKKALIRAGAICVTCIGSQMGKTIISPYNSATNQQINSIEVNLRALRNFLFLSLKNRRDELYLLGSSGSTMPIVNKSTFERLKNLVPHEKILSSFDSFVEPLFNKILASTVEIQDVAILRDTLLPKLLSGQLRVPDAEKLMAEAL